MGRGLAWSPKDYLVASGDDDGIIRITDVATQTEVGWFSHDNGNRIHKVRFSPDGTLLATCGFRDVRVWNLHTMREVSRIKDITGADWGTDESSSQGTGSNWIEDLRFSPTSDQIAISSVGFGTVGQVWPLRQSDLLSEVKQRLPRKLPERERRQFLADLGDASTP